MLGEEDGIQFYVSSWGRVKSDPYTLTTPIGNRQITRTFEVKPTFGSRNKNRVNYKFKKKNYKVHKLVCEAFHGPKPFPEAIVLHIDEDYTNNHYTNLKWGTHKENATAPSLIEYNNHVNRRDIMGRWKSITKQELLTL
jgi:hypothetical protein